MMRKTGGLAILFGLLTACTTGHDLFPSGVTQNVDPTFDFTAWRDASPNNPSGKSNEGHRVELGGRILQATPRGQGVLIVAEELPVVEHPVFGPSESAKRPQNDYEFAVLYPGVLDPGALRNGNKFIVVGTTKGRTNVVLEGAPKTEPYMIADCVHIWQTGRTPIENFKEDAGAGFSPLPHQTYCAKKS